jgi:hypothetical protein
MLFWFLVGHAVADFPLQGPFLSAAKSHRNPVRTDTGKAFPWWLALTAHAAIHAGAVAAISGSVVFGCAEFAAHCVIDYQTTEGRWGYVTDQALHWACKVLWIVALRWLP